jgi:hypothetical protein
MAIEKYNVYMPAQNLTNLSLNVDINRIGIDKINIDVNYGTSPATVSIKEGSIIEVNVNLYVINGSDYTFQMANATHNYITFTDNPSPTFGSAAAVGTYSNDKKAYYQADNVTRTLGWFIDQSISEHFIYLIRQTQVYDSDLMIDRVSVSNSAPQGLDLAPMVFDIVLLDRLLNFDTVNSMFVCKYAGDYGINFSGVFYRGILSVGMYCNISVNGVAISTYYQDLSATSPATINMFVMTPLSVGDEITITTSRNIANAVAVAAGAVMGIFRIL